MKGNLVFSLTYSGRFNSPCASTSLPSSPRTEGSFLPDLRVPRSKVGPAVVQLLKRSTDCSSPRGGWKGCWKGWEASYQLVPNWLTALGRGALQQRANPNPPMLCSLATIHCSTCRHSVQACTYAHSKENLTHAAKEELYSMSTPPHHILQSG